MASGRWGVLLLLAAVTGMAGGCSDRGRPPDRDRLHVSNAGGEEVGLLIDARDVAGDLNDRGVVTRAADLEVGDLRRSGDPDSNQVIAFARKRPPLLVATPWTPQSDRFELELGREIAIPVTVWIVFDPLGTQHDRAKAACNRAARIWEDERMGVTLSECAVKDETGNSKAPDYYDFPNCDPNCDPVPHCDLAQRFQKMAEDIGFDLGRINVYSVKRVSCLTGGGLSDFGAHIALGSETSVDLLVHELGHAFSLTHPVDDCNFNQENVMVSSSVGRLFFTEGQLFRAHFNPKSALRLVYQARSDLPRFCHPCIPSTKCMPLHRRLWADGRFAPY